MTPINRALYPPNWEEISSRVKREQGWRCLWCKVPHGIVVVRPKSGPEWWTEEDCERHGYPRCDYVLIKIVLTTAHLDHDPKNNARANLAGLCQRCHLAYDARQHAATAQRTRFDRKAIGILPGLGLPK